jgi:O-antigen/teichoic acid export membrane protein
MWMTIISATSLLSFSDFGLGSAVTSILSQSNSPNQSERSRSYVSNAFILLSAASLILVCVLFFLYPLVPWSRLFNVTSSVAAREAGPATAVFGICTLLMLPCSLSGRVQLGLQEGYKLHLWTAVGAVLGLLGVIVCIQLRTGLVPLVAATALGPLFAMGVNLVVQFGVQHPELRPAAHLFEWRIATDIGRTGTIFLLQQALSALTYALDNFIIIRMIGPEAVAVFAVTQKLFAMALLSQFLWLPLWPAFGDAFARHDRSWIKTNFQRAMLLNIGLNSGAGVVLAAFGRLAIPLLTGRAVVPAASLLLAFAVKSAHAGFLDTMNAVLNHGPTLRRHVKYYGIAALASVPAKIGMCHLFGTPGVVWGGLLAFAVFHLIPASGLAHQRVRST